MERNPEKVDSKTIPPSEETRDNSRRKLSHIRNSITEKVIANLTPSFTNFRTTQDQKMVNLDEEREKLQMFEKYLNEDGVHEKMSRGMREVLDRDLCDFMNAKEAFRLNAYDEREGVLKLHHLREQRDNLKNLHSDMMKKMITLQVNKINYERRMREKYKTPNLTAKSSGHWDTTYVFGYGFTYGTGYSDHCKPSTAPGFEFAASANLKRLIKTCGPTIGQKDFHQLYKKIFDFKTPNRDSSEHTDHTKNKQSTQSNIEEQTSTYASSIEESIT